MLTITPTTRRQFILGRQGLWPGRRWQGMEGTAQALLAAEMVQIDPVSVLLPSADIVLWGRVAGYKPAFLDNLLHEAHRFFDYNDPLYIYPMDELPYWRVKMERRKTGSRWVDFQRDHAGVKEAVLEEIKARGALCSRDLEGRKVSFYRSGKDTGVALFYLWLTGELMTHHRNRIERYYDLFENIAPANLRRMASTAEAEAFFNLKNISTLGMVKLRDIRRSLVDATDTPVDAKTAKDRAAEMIAEGDLAELRVEGERDAWYICSGDLPLLEELQSGCVPDAWKPLGATTSDEVVFLSPLEMVSARGRAKELFEFNYVWEVYTPAHKRQYGPYTLPVLYGDRLVARMDARLDRKAATLLVNGFWLEEWFEPDTAFVGALQAGLKNFAGLMGVETPALPPFTR